MSNVLKEGTEVLVKAVIDQDTYGDDFSLVRIDNHNHSVKISVNNDLIIKNEDKS